MIPVVFVPAAPLLLPDVNPTATADVAAVRAAMHDAARYLADCARIVAICAYSDQQPDRVAPVPPWQEWPVGVSTTHDSPTALTGGAVGSVVPSSVEVARWVLAELGVMPAVLVSVFGDAAGFTDAARTVTLQPGDGLLVVADGSAGRHEKAPGHIREGALEFDAEVAHALATGDSAALLALQPARAEAVLAGGLPAWQATALIVQGYLVCAPELLLAADPHHVAYFVATWHLRADLA